MDVKGLKNIAVVSIENGEKVGTVSDVLFNIDRRVMQAVVVSHGSRFGGSRRVVDAEEVRSIGPDAVMIPNLNVLNGDPSEDRFRAYPDIGALTSLKVVTESGEFVGPLSTLQIDLANGRITDIEISRGGLSGIFKSNIVVRAEEIISIGRDVAVVPDRYGSEESAGQAGSSTEASSTTTETTESPLT